MDSFAGLPGEPVNRGSVCQGWGPPWTLEPARMCALLVGPPEATVRRAAPRLLGTTSVTGIA